MTVSQRPVIQAAWNKELTDQGVMPCDVLVSINGKALGDIDAVRRRLHASLVLNSLNRGTAGGHEDLRFSIALLGALGF